MQLIPDGGFERPDNCCHGELLTLIFPKNAVLDAELPARLSIKMTGEKKKKRKENANG